MKCNICGNEFSASVYPHHYNWCKEQGVRKENNEYNHEELKELAKKNDVKSWWVKGEETLKEELEELGVI